MAKKVSKMAIRIIPIIEGETVACFIYGEEALMKWDAGECLTDNDDVIECYFSTNDKNTIVLHDGKIVRFETENIKNIQK